MTTKPKATKPPALPGPREDAPLPSPALTADMKHEATPPAKIAEALAPKASRCTVCGNPVVNRCEVCGHEAK